MNEPYMPSNGTENRVIKFRVWDTKLNRWHPNIISLDIDNVLTDGADSRFIVMQFTGLRDKNGKEIYEGDILKADRWKYNQLVQFDQIKARFNCVMNPQGSQNDYIPADNVVVIGNIFENPELITN
jgi:hypothetical protein